MPCTRCGQKRSKPVATARAAASTQTYTYTPPSGASTTQLTRHQAENLRTRNGGQGRITPDR